MKDIFKRLNKIYEMSDPKNEEAIHFAFFEYLAFCISRFIPKERAHEAVDIAYEKGRVFNNIFSDHPNLDQLKDEKREHIYRKYIAESWPQAREKRR